MEQLASLRRDNEIMTKKIQEQELRAKKRAAALATGGIKSSDDQQPESRDSPGQLVVQKKSAVVQRPGSRGNPLAPINPKRLAPQVSEYI